MPKREEMNASDADQRMERMMGFLLRTGVLAAACAVACGGVLYLAGHGGDRTGYSVFQARPLSVDHPLRLMQQLRASRAEAMVDVGILLLLATPILRVVLGLLSFARERDWMYVVVSTLVLTALLFGTFHGS